MLHLTKSYRLLHYRAFDTGLHYNCRNQMCSVSPHYRSFTWTLLCKIVEKRVKTFDGLRSWRALNLRLSVSPMYERNRDWVLNMQIPGPHFLTRGLEQGLGIYISTNWFPYRGPRGHSLRSWNAVESVSMDIRPGNYSLFLDHIHGFKPPSVRIEGWRLRT